MKGKSMIRVLLFLAFLIPGTSYAAQVVAPCGSITLSVGSGSNGTVDTSGNGCVAPPATTPTTQSAGTVTTGGVFQTVLAANASRTNCLIQNTSAHTAYVYWLATGSASLTNALQVQPGASFACINPSGAPIRTAIQWTTSTTGDAFVVTENQ